MREISPKSVGGFETAVLRHKKQVNPTQSMALALPNKDLKAGIFLISNNSSPVISSKIEEKIEGKRGRSSRPKKKTINRKHTTMESEITHNGKTYSINSKGSGIYKEIMIPIIDQFEVAKKEWRRVFVLRFDLHQPWYTPDNRHVTQFRDRLFKKLKRTYGFKKIGFCWVREQERSKTQHYHWVLFLDGNLIRHSSKINETIKKAWERPNGGYHVPVIKRPFHFVDSDDSIQEAIYRISYLAKARGKGYRDKQAKDYQCSRMKPT